MQVMQEKMNIAISTDLTGARFLFFSLIAGKPCFVFITYKKHNERHTSPFSSHLSVCEIEMSMTHPARSLYKLDLRILLPLFYKQRKKTQASAFIVWDWQALAL